jgi:hypothetical protein
MDVRELAPALLGIGDVFLEASSILNGSRAQVSVLVRAEFQRGSFEVLLEVGQTILAQAKTFLLADDLKAAKELAVILFGTGTVGSLSVWGVIKWLRGRKPSGTSQLPDGGVRIQIDNHVHLDVPRDVARLYNSPQVRDASHRVVRPLQQPGIDQFEVQSGDRAVDTVVSKEEVPYFAPALAPTTEMALLESERVDLFELVKPSFEPHLSWVFSDGQSRFDAFMRDEVFIRRVASREVAFAKGDLMRVRIHTRKVQTDRGLRTEYTVLEVLEILPGPRQLSLLESAPDPRALPPSTAP